MAADIIITNEGALVEKSATPKSIRQAAPYISRMPIYFTNPTFMTYDQWRLVAREPVTRLCIRHIIREITALEWDISSKNSKKDEEQIKYYKGIFDRADDGEGLDALVSRTLQDALELPIGGNIEMAPDSLTHMLGGLYHIDGATLYPTYDMDIPFVQIDPYNANAMVWFGRDELLRLQLQPRPDIKRRQFQEAPVESAFLAIEALSKIYLYYIRQLSDTPMAGVLDLMDFTQDEAIEWAVGFRELFESIDPLKIPLLYDHTKPAKFLPFGRSPNDLNIVEQFKRFAEIVAASFGLSIGDLRLFEHERTLAGVEASQRVTARQGTGFYAQSIEDLFNKGILNNNQTGFEFKYKMGMTGELQAEATLSLQRAQILQTLTGNAPLVKPMDAQKQLIDWKMVTVDLTGLPQTPGLPGLEGFGDNINAVDSIDQDTGAMGEIANQKEPMQQIDEGSQYFEGKSLAIRKRKSDADLVAASLTELTGGRVGVVPMEDGNWSVYGKV